MINLDPQVHERLGRAIYGLGRAESAFCLQVASRLGLAFPLRTRALQYRGRQAPPDLLQALDALPESWVLDLHPGLLYLLSRGDPPLPEHPDLVLAGPASPMPAAEKLVRGIQQAIIAMRQLELQQQRDQADAAPLRETERQLFLLCASQFRQSGAEGARETLDLWLQVMHRRHHLVLNDLRRQLLEHMTAVTRDAEEVHGLSTAVAALVTEIYATYVIGDLLALYRDRLPVIAELARDGRRLVPDPEDHSLVGRARHHIAAHYRHPIQLQHVAAAVGVSPPHLARRFKAATGRSVGQELLRLRLREARVLLANENQTVQVVAETCGFSSVEHFHRLFRREIGETPGAYRQRHASPKADD